MRSVTHWMHDHHWDSASLHQHWTGFFGVLKNVWLGLLLLVLGIVALITAVIIAYPVTAYIAAKFFQ
ncbi:hypothetical protein C2E25_11130 [Geothermobacter hydrogeniphilus]|uniref:Uncharacterized protein n=1 Tax=Geothermobacter hydrogeniphilus TaxID=1969733 RepID=A0A2K2H941_9BACT|nr:hypothetical protein [Geothermobacter hydrogeniphilus]PNU19740.1 hypothetical protein C2E25_11130 [Geothermobacter hydrogeniphilus]